MKKIVKKISSFFVKIWKFIDKKIVIPVTKLVLLITSKFDKSGKKVEGWLSKSTTLLFISLFLAVTVFIVVDQKILVFSESSAEVLKSQPVKAIYNEEAYIVEGLPETVDITLIGSKTDLYIAKQSPFYDVTVDLTGLKPGQHKVNIRYNQSSTSIDYKVNPSVATVIIYQKISETRTLAIDVLNQDSLDQKLTIKNINIDNDKVIIKGAEHQLKKVATVKALVDVKNLVKQEVGTIVLKDIPLKAYDDRGNVVDVEIVPNKITAEIEIVSPSKEIPIKVVPTGEVAFGQAINTITSSATKVTVYGSEEALANLNFLEVNVDVADLKQNREYKLELPKPVGIKFMTVNSVTVSVTLESVAQKEISGISIEPRNLSDKYNVQGMGENDIKISVILKGVESVIKNIQAGDINAYIDLKGYGEGTFEVEVQVSGTDPKVQYIPKTKKVKIKITAK